MNKPDSLTQAVGLIETILSEMEGLSKPRVRFLVWIISAWLGLPVRRTISNLARFGPYCEKSIRLHLARDFCFAEFGRLLLTKCCGTREHPVGGGAGATKCAELVCAFDPTHIRKSGKHTYGVDYWWCGTLRKAVRGLELGVIGIIDVEVRSAFSLQATQTPSIQTLQGQGKTLIDHYVSLLSEQKQRLVQLGISVITADAYFAKKSFVDAVVKMGFGVVTRMRPDANLLYLYHGPHQPKNGPKKKGAHKKYHGKVDCKCIDKRRLRLFQRDQHYSCYSGVVYAVGFKRLVRVVYIQENKVRGQVQRYRILMSSDIHLAPDKILEYYKLRFQIEFLIRDAKTHAGLEECQARDQHKLFFHFNLALLTVSLAKAAFWRTLPEQQRGAFSLRNIKLLFAGQLWTNRVFQNLGLDHSLEKYQNAYQRCLNIDQWAA